ncbi:carboxylesterase family protein [uncultured Draconibacterium sp.]|uniref:carboxylesterase/lipase family protein n=1 Tax=uncultured Draconibacterium sp. TaxID=1573823 RepID=UPI0025D0F076|nr:carboxylesterase family protein [uncultured Draconibacterium sp.]
MKNIMKSLFTGLLIFGITLSINAQQNSGPEVKTKSGIVRGVTEGDVSSFKGIPFAAPPVDEFRWRPPQPVKSWDGVRDATEFGPTCAAVGWGAAPGTIQQGSSEDCLYLNVWTPSSFKQGAKLPVMVWIHGGGFTGGSGNTNGAGFAKQGVILVSMNYRLGRLGHFAFPALSAEHPEEGKGSYAFMDQIAALKWVQKNIEAFGGDPDNVTIFGFSAGGVSVHSLLTIPNAKGLFHKAIGHSSGGRDGVLTGRPINKENADPLYPVSAETIGINFAKMRGIDGTDAAALAKLRALPVVDIVGGGETDGQGGPRIYPGPILDYKFVVETAESAYNAGRQAKVPVMMGNNSAEIGGGFVNSSTTKEELFSLFGDFEAEAKAAYDPDGNKEFAEVQARFNTDWVWGEPARFTAREFTAIGESAYIFLFDYVPSYMAQRAPYGPGHGTDISFAFDILGEGGGFGPPPTPTAADKEVARVMNAYWVNFAKTGNPNGKDLPNWPLNNSKTNQILEFQRDGLPVGKTDPTKARLDVVEKAMKKRAVIQTRGGI